MNNPAGLGFDNQLVVMTSFHFWYTCEVLETRGQALIQEAIFP
jgi:hypothetical protein